VEVVVVFLAELALAEEPALPVGDVSGDERQKAQSVVWRHHRNAEHVAEGREDEEPLHRGADLQRLLGGLVPEEAEEEFADGVERPPALMTIALAVALVLVMGWFAVGSIWNVRKGRDTLRWFQGGLRELGEKTTLRWLGTTSVELVIARANAPFTAARIVVFLEPRDVPWIWALSRRKGRRDALIFRAETRHAPHFDLEALDASSWSGREARRTMTSEPWTAREPSAAERLTVYTKTGAAVALADRLLAAAREAGMTVRRLSVRRREPHLQLHVDLPGPPMPAPGFFRALRAIGERAMDTS
jgi:hypothetical protein